MPLGVGKNLGASLINLKLTTMAHVYGMGSFRDHIVEYVFVVLVAATYVADVTFMLIGINL